MTYSQMTILHLMWICIWLFKWRKDRPLICWETMERTGLRTLLNLTSAIKCVSMYPLVHHSTWWVIVRCLQSSMTESSSLCANMLLLCQKRQTSLLIFGRWLPTVWCLTRSSWRKWTRRRQAFRQSRHRRSVLKWSLLVRKPSVIRRWLTRLIWLSWTSRHHSLFSCVHGMLSRRRMVQT